MARSPRRARRTPPPLVLAPRWRRACLALQVVPLPGVGAVLAGWKNPQTRLRTHGLLQAGLVLFGSWPLLVPGAAGLAWALWDLRPIWAAQPPGRLSEPAPGWREPLAAQGQGPGAADAATGTDAEAPPGAPRAGAIRSREKRHAP